MEIIKKIKNREAKIAVIGLGYVGLPLSVEFARAGFRVIGIDTDEKRLSKLKRGISYIEDVKQDGLHKLIKQGRFSAGSDYAGILNADAVIICVPTPMRKTKEPDISYVLCAAEQIEKYLNKPKLVILESTTYPDTTSELILPILKKNGKAAGRDFFLGYSPERVDPGNRKYTTANIPKIISGVTPNCLNLVKILYSRVFNNVIPVSSTKVAETIKLLENTFRTVNIALVNEIAIMCHRMGIDVWEVIRGASTKPFGFMPFYPGPGIGGACLPKDPHYLAWRARHFDARSRFIEVASDITTSMPIYIVERIKDLLQKKRNKLLKGSQILVLGVAYKKDIGDTRDSPALDIIRLLGKSGAEVIYNDPFVPEITLNDRKYTSAELSNDLLKKSDIVVITTAHSRYNLSKITENAKLVFDTRGVTWDIAKNKKNVVRL